MKTTLFFAFTQDQILLGVIVLVTAVGTYMFFYSRKQSVFREQLLLAYPNDEVIKWGNCEAIVRRGRRVYKISWNGDQFSEKFLRIYRDDY